MKQIIYAFLVTIIILCIFLCGCTSETNELKITDTVIYGTVTEVSGDTVKLTVGMGLGDMKIPEDMSGAVDPFQPQGETSEVPLGEISGEITENSEGGMTPPGMGDISVPEIPDGEDPGARGNTNPGEMGGEVQPGENMFGGAYTMTLTVSDTSVLFNNDNGTESACDISKITENSYLAISVDADGKITKIVVYGENPINGATENMNNGEIPENPNGEK